MNEHGAIEKYIRPLLRGRSDDYVTSQDDAAQVFFPKSSIVVTKDLLVEGMHFLSGSDPKLLAKKALRVNLSDLASMGSTPHSYLLGLSLPKGTTEKWWKKFTEGLKEDNSLFSINLVGGDVTSNGSSVIVISITALGILQNRILTRDNAKVGDYLYVSGTIGDAALGLMAYQEKISGKCIYLKQRYDLPIPRVNLSTSMATFASACIDISDGLLQDVQKMCKISRVGATIEALKIPLSEEARAALQSNKKLFEGVVTGGDDYELAFTVPPESCAQVEQLAKNLDVSISKIGTITSEPDVHILDENNNKIAISKQGYVHTF